MNITTKLENNKTLETDPILSGVVYCWMFHLWITRKEDVVSELHKRT